MEEIAENQREYVKAEKDLEEAPTGELIRIIQKYMNLLIDDYKILQDELDALYIKEYTRICEEERDGEVVPGPYGQPACETFTDAASDAEDLGSREPNAEFPLITNRQGIDSWFTNLFRYEEPPQSLNVFDDWEGDIWD